MIKNYNFSCPVGGCTFEYDKHNNLYMFVASIISGEKLIYALPKNPFTSQILSTEGDIMDTCRGLVDILMVGTSVDLTYITKLQQFKNRDAFLPTFLGNYHTCLLEDTPWDESQVDCICGLFTNETAKYFRDMTGIYVDTGEQIIIVPSKIKNNAA